MLTVSYPEVWGFEHAFRGMRNPLKSHDKSTENADLILAKKLISAGSEHRKFLTIMKEPFVLADFGVSDGVTCSTYFIDIISTLNSLRFIYSKTKSEEVWETLIQILPQSYLQTRTVTFTYETALNIIKQRRGHKVKEWDIFISHLFKLPHMSEFYMAMEG